MKSSKKSRSARVDESADNSLQLAKNIETGEYVIATQAVMYTEDEQDRRNDKQRTIDRMRADLDREENEKIANGQTQLVVADGQTGRVKTPQE